MVKIAKLDNKSLFPLNLRYNQFLGVRQGQASESVPKAFFERKPLNRSIEGSLSTMVSGAKQEPSIALKEFFCLKGSRMCVRGLRKTRQWTVVGRVKENISLQGQGVNSLSTPRMRIKNLREHPLTPRLAIRNLREKGQGSMFGIRKI